MASYSRFQVGAALEAADGRVFTGCNIENAAYPQGSCAEAGAIAAMIRDGARKIREIAIIGGGAELCTPCGGCRQRIREFADAQTRIHVCDGGGLRRRGGEIGVVAWKEVGSDRPFPRLLQAILMLLGMPRAVKRLMQRTATLASTFWRSKLRERRLGPMRVL